jgi:transposase
LGLGVSDDTVLGQQKKRATDTAEPPTVIGIDDLSWRKSKTYGTIVVGLERRVVIDILEDRDVATCTNWLKRHPEVKVISRDRCGLFAQAARQGAPQAQQVADRFHIVQTLRQAIEEQMNLHSRATGRISASQHRESSRPRAKFVRPRARDRGY